MRQAELVFEHLGEDARAEFSVKQLLAWGFDKELVERTAKHYSNGKSCCVLYLVSAIAQSLKVPTDNVVASGFHRQLRQYKGAMAKHFKMELPGTISDFQDEYLEPRESGLQKA